MLLEFDIRAWAIGFFVLAMLLVKLRRRGGYFLFFFSVFWIYLLVLVSVTIFPIPVGMEAGFHHASMWAQVAFMFKYSGLNLTPLYFGNCWDLPRACATGIYENILMTVPFGFGINFIARFRKGDYVWLAFLVGFTIEMAQFVMDMAIGAVYRTVDANDVLFNGLGVWVGYGLFLAWACCYFALCRRFHFRRAGLLAYLSDVAGPAEAVG